MNSRPRRGLKRRKLRAPSLGYECVIRRISPIYLFLMLRLSYAVLYVFSLFGGMSRTRGWEKDIFSDCIIWLLTKECYTSLQLLINY